MICGWTEWGHAFCCLTQLFWLFEQESDLTFFSFAKVKDFQICGGYPLFSGIKSLLISPLPDSFLSLGLSITLWKGSCFVVLYCAQTIWERIECILSCSKGLPIKFRTTSTIPFSFYRTNLSFPNLLPPHTLPCTTTTTQIQNLPKTSLLLPPPPN